MRLQTSNLSEQVQRILDEDGISPGELSHLAGISKQTIYSIIRNETATTQRAIARRIAEGTGREFRIHGDRITFTKKAIESSSLEKLKNLSEKDLEILEKIMSLSEGAKEDLLKLILRMRDDD